MNYQKSNLEELKKDLIVDAKKGYPFLLAGALYWFTMGILSLFIDDHRLLALCYLIGSGSIFPLAIVLSKMLQVNMLSENPLGVLGGLIGGIQGFYLLIWIVIYVEHYELLPMTIGILGASHFLPYLWIYNSKTYGIFTVLMAIISFVFGYIFINQAFLTLPFLLAAIYLISVIGLRLETNKYVASLDN